MRKGKIQTAKIKPINVVLNIIFYAILIFMLFFIVIVHYGQSRNQMIPIFGFSIAVIQSGSMVDGGFDVGDKVIIKSTKTEKLRVDDIIVFYKYADPADTALAKTDITTIVDTYEPPDLTTQQQQQKGMLEETRKSKKEAAETGAKLVFHRIKAIFVDEYGTKFFQTKGDSNNTTDGILIRDDFIAGQYCETAPIITGFLNFISTTWGMLVVIVTPIAILTLMQVMTFMTEMSGNVLVRKLLQRKISITDKEFEHLDINEYFQEDDKLYLYYTAPDNEKEDMIKFLWGDLNSENLDETQKVAADKLKKSFEIYNANPKAFWGFWLANAEGKFSKRGIEIYAIASVIVEKEGLDYEKAHEKALKVYKQKNGKDLDSEKFKNSKKRK